MRQGVDNKHLFLFHQCAEDLDLVVDLRRMINKKKVTLSGGISELCR